MNNKVICTKCLTEYEFSEKWFDKNDSKLFICRICKIKKTTKNPEFRKNASLRSKEILSNDNIKSRMSQIAIMNNINNSHKISESLKKYFKKQTSKDQISNEVKKRWKNPNYKDKISKSIQQKWNDPSYRGKIIGSRVRLNKKSLKNIYSNCIENYSIERYTFDAFINGIYLYDKKFSKEKSLFIEHNLNKFIYINDLAEVGKPEN